MSSNKICVEETMELAKVITTLEDVLESLRGGSLTVTRGGESVTLTPPGVVNLELEASQKKDKAKLTIELTWKNAKNSIGEGLSIG